MRQLLLLVVILVMSCGDDTTISAPADMAVHPHDCAGFTLCSCQDGTCQRRSACGTMSCADVCAGHAGAGGTNCTGDAGL